MFSQRCIAFAELCAVGSQIMCGMALRALVNLSASSYNNGLVSFLSQTTTGRTMPVWLQFRADVTPEVADV